MKKVTILPIVFLLLFSLFSFPLAAQTTGNVRSEILLTLAKWNAAANNAEALPMLALFDNTDSILAVGSDKGEIFKGRKQVADWLSHAFEKNRFSLDMKRVDIDYNGNTAWVFVEGTLAVSDKENATAEAMTMPYRFTGIMVKKNKQWKWRLFNGSSPQEPPAH